MSQEKNYFSSKQQQQVNNNRSCYEKQSRLETEEDTKKKVNQENVDNSSYLVQKQMLDLIQQQKQSINSNNKENYYYRYLRQMTSQNFLNTEPAMPSNTVSTNSISHNANNLGATSTSNKAGNPIQNKSRERPSVNENYKNSIHNDMVQAYKENRLEKTDKYDKRSSNNASRIGSKTRMSNTNKSSYLGESQMDTSNNNMMEKQQRDTYNPDKSRKRTDSASTNQNAKFLYNVIMNGSKDKKVRRDMYNSKKAQNFK